MLLSPGLSFIWPPLLSSSMFSISSPTWLMMWSFLEINMFSFLMFLSTPSTPINSETSLKYLVIQATSSSVLILSAMVSNINYYYFTGLMILITILFKLGAAPFHQWFVSVAKALPVKTFTLLLTWQKVIPLMLASSFLIKTKGMTIILLLNALVGALGGLMQTTLRPLLCYSSINHISWMLMAMKSSPLTFIIYLMTYFSMLLMLMNSSLTLTPLNHWGQQNMMKSKPHSNTAALNLLSLAGMPPLIGFVIKWAVLKDTYMNLMIIAIMILAAMTTLLYYIMISLVNMLHSQESHKSKMLFSMDTTLISHMLTPMFIIMLL